MSEAITLPSEANYTEGPGALLARARRDAGRSVADIASSLRYSAKQIEALEADDFAKLPGTAFVKGMLRGYAKLLKIPQDPIIQALERRHIPSPVSVDLRTQRVPFSETKERSSRVYVWICLLLLLILASVVFEWQFGEWQIGAWPGSSSSQTAAVTRPEVPSTHGQSPQEATPINATIHSEPITPTIDMPKSESIQAPANNAVPAAIPTALGSVGKGGMRFEFQKDAWIEVRDGAGRVLISQLNPAGSRALLEGAPPFSVIVGNASAVQLYYAENPVDLRPHTKVDVARFVLN